LSAGKLSVLPLEASAINPQAIILKLLLLDESHIA
jgi:hypothetical protein